MKNIPDIRSLLDRYWEGETTLEEERLLKEFFASGQAPERYGQEAEYFRALRTEQAVRLPEKPALSVRRIGLFRIAAAASVLLLLSAGLWWWQRPAPDPVSPAAPVARTEAPAPVQTTPGRPAEQMPAPLALSEKPARKTKFRRPDAPARPAETRLPEDTCEDPEQALAELRNALALVSAKLKKGKREIGKGLQEIEVIRVPGAG